MTTDRERKPKRVNDERETVSQVIARSAVETDVLNILAADDPEAVMLDFVQPPFAGRRLDSLGREARGIKPTGRCELSTVISRYGNKPSSLDTERAGAQPVGGMNMAKRLHSFGRLAMLKVGNKDRFQNISSPEWNSLQLQSTLCKGYFETSEKAHAQKTIQATAEWINRSHNHCEGHALRFRASDRDLIRMTEVSRDDTADSFHRYDSGSLDGYFCFFGKVRCHCNVGGPGIEDKISSYAVDDD
jgi:hypothetical protein